MDCLRTLLMDFIELCKLAKKKIITTLIDCILFFDLLPTRSPRNWSDRAPLTSPSGRAFFPTPLPPRLHIFSWWLCVVCCRSLPKTMIRSVFYFLNFLSPHAASNDVKSSPHMFRHGRISSKHLPTSPMLSFGWLVCVSSFHCLVVVYSHGVYFFISIFVPWIVIQNNG